MLTDTQGLKPAEYAPDIPIYMRGTSRPQGTSFCFVYSAGRISQCQVSLNNNVAICVHFIETRIDVEF